MDFSDIFARLKASRPTSVDDRILIIDATNTFLRVWSSIPSISTNGEHVGGILGFLRSVGLNIREFNPSRCIIVFDGHGGSVRRKKLFPEYKSGRIGKHRLKRDEFATHEEEELSKRKQLLRIIQYLNLLPVQIFCIDNIEADDVIAYLTMQYFAPKDSKIRIVSADRDFLQLVSEKVEIYSPVKKKLYSPEILREEIGILPDNYLLYRMVDGDTSDSIPGVQGVGLKTLVKSFPEMNEKPLDFEYLLEQSEIRSKEKKAPKIYETILNHRMELDRNFRLMQLAETDISMDAKMKILNQVQQPFSKLEKVLFQKMIIEDHLTDQFRNVNNWLLSTFNTLNSWALR